MVRQKAATSAALQKQLHPELRRWFHRQFSTANRFC
jgi:hypothetical protein